MKKIIYLVFLLTAFKAHSQSVIASYSFESVPAATGGLTPGTTPAFVSGSSGASDGPASSPFYTDGDSAWGISNTSANITFANISLSGYTNCFVQFRLGSWSLGSASNGADNGDSVHVQISTDGGSTWSSELKINGSSNAYWSYTSGTGLDSIQYDGDNTPAVAAPAGGGSRTSDGYSTIKIMIPNAYSQVRVRIYLRNNSTAERWTVDQLEIKGSPSGSSNSDIISGGNEMSNIDYAAKTGPSITSTSVAHKVWSFTIRDGGGSSDADALTTVLGAVTIDKGTSNGVSSWANTIKQAALFDGTTKVAEISVTSESMVFSGLSGSNVTAADDGSKTLDLYLTFETTNITDNTQFQFRIQNANVTATGSQFSSFTAASSSVTSDKNRIEVTATKLNFVQQPSNTAYNTSMSPAVTVEAADANNMRDLDFTSSVRITSSGTLTGTNIDTVAVSGLATYSTLKHTSVGSYTLTARRTATLDWNQSSNAFSISGSNASDIIAATFTYSSNINYMQYQASTITNTSHSIAVYKFTIRDGGASANDADNLSTTLSSITFSSVAGIANIRSAALFDGNTMVSNTPTISTSGSTIAFSGLSYACSDDQTRDLTLRVSFESSSDSVTDNSQMSFTIASANVSASTSGSTFTSFSSITSSTTTDRNRIEADAMTIAIVTQPLSGYTGSNLAAFTINITDTFGVKDLDYSGSVSLSTNGTGMSSGSPHTISSGAVSISNVKFSSGNTDIYIVATTSGLSYDNDDTSSTFSIANVKGDSYRTSSAGTWPSSGTATWERFVNGAWSSASAPASGTTDSVYIRHAVSTNAAWGSTSSTFIIQSGGSFTVNQNGTLAYCRVDSGGTLNVLNAGFTLTSSTPKNFLLCKAANMVLNTNGLDNGDNFWNGNEDFQSGSTITIQDWNFGGSGGIKRLVANPSQISTNTSGYLMGNLTITASPSSIFGMIDGSQTIKLCENDFTLNTSGGSNVTFTTALSNVEIGGDLIVSANQFSFAASSSTGNITSTINGKIRINNSAVIDLNQNSSSNTASLVTLKGNLEIYNSSSIKSTDGGCAVNFNGTSTQQIDFASSATTISDNVDYNIKSGATAQLANNNWKVGNGTDIVVESGGILDFNFNGSTPLNITESGGTTSFNLNAGGKIIITSADGIDVTGTDNVGNIRLDTRTYSSTGIYHYKGKASSQRVGDGLPTASGGKYVIVELDALSTQLLFEGYNGSSYVSTGNIGISSSGNGLNIIQGTITATTSADFNGSGNFTMSGGLYKSSVDSVTSLVPQMSGTYSITGGTIELNGSNIIQRLRGGKTYYNIKCSGTNTLNTNYKSISSSITIDNNLTITGSAIFDPVSNGVSGNGGLTMDGGRFRISKVSSSQPELTATASGQSYSLTGGIVELYNSSSSQQQTLRARDGNSNTITYYNMELNASGANVSIGNINPNYAFNVSGTLNVNSPCVLRLDAGDIIGGTGNLSIKSGAGLWMGHASGLNSQVAVSGTKTYSKQASYGFIGSAATITGSSFPDSVANLYMRKNDASHTLTFTNAVVVTSSASLDTGIILGSTNPIVTFTDNATVSGASDSCYISGQVKKIGDDAFTFPIGKSGTGYQAVSISAPDHTADAFTAEYMRGNPRAYNSEYPTGIQHISTCEYWQLTENNDAGSNTSISVTMNFNLNSGCGTASGTSYITDLTKLHILHFNGTKWEDFGNAITSGNHDVGSITANNVSSFSPFTLGSENAPPENPLPLSWLGIQAQGFANYNHITWTVANEVNVLDYHIEKSKDGNIWNAVGTVEAKQYNGSNKVGYEYKDLEVQLSQTTFYRVKQNDLDGRYSYSPSVKLMNSGDHKQLQVSVYNAPSDRGSLYISLDGNEESYLLEIYNTAGQKIESKKVNNGAQMISLKEIHQGIYLVRIIGKTEEVLEKIVVN